ncbi:MAG: hypothetical protein DRI57_24990 [Deltaproteobacteria bacterium]|nr:MAG: hypothetical protein DRI57_24990 [Deltaproteobacteria bacterium]
MLITSSYFSFFVQIIWVRLFWVESEIQSYKYYQFHPEAETEHLETVAYCESQQPGLGVPLYLSDFESVMEQVCKFPMSYPIERKPEIRRIRLKRFAVLTKYLILNELSACFCCKLSRQSSFRGQKERHGRQRRVWGRTKTTCDITEYGWKILSEQSLKPLF